MTWLDALGFGGSLIVVVQYFRTVKGVADTGGLPFLGTNLLGSLLVIASLSQNFNPPSFAIEVFWSGVSLYGIVRYRLRGRA